jgi:hypothetical protein
MCNKVELSPQDVNNMQPIASFDSFILSFDKAVKIMLIILGQDSVLNRPKNTACEKVSFATIGWTNQQQTTTPAQD